MSIWPTSPFAGLLSNVDVEIPPAAATSPVRGGALEGVGRGAGPGSDGGLSTSPPCWTTAVGSIVIGSTPATTDTVDSATEITAVPPAGSAVTTVGVRVVTPGGTSATSSADRFSYATDQTQPFVGCHALTPVRICDTRSDHPPNPCTGTPPGEAVTVAAEVVG